MNAEAPIGEAGAPLATVDTGGAMRWRADLQLRFARRGPRTVLVDRLHSGPLMVQKALYPEGDATCHVVIVHPPGGIAGGDHLALRVRLDAGAHALLTTPGAGKWYKANGLDATQHLCFELADAALFEWLPQETILFDAARARMQARIDLHGDARYAGWDIVCLGRRAAGERFRSGLWSQRLQIVRDGELLWGDYADVAGGDPLLQSVVGLHGRGVVGRVLIAAGAVPDDVLERCRAVEPAPGDACGVTALPGVLVATCLGDSAEAVRAYCEALWRVARPWYADMPARRPRIWNT